MDRENNNVPPASADEWTLAVLAEIEARFGGNITEHNKETHEQV